MTLSLPWTFSKDDPAGKDLEDRLQDVLDAVAQQFPVGIANVSQVPQARVYNSAALTIANTTQTALTFDSEHWDTATLHSVAANTSRLTAVLIGLYELTASVEWAFNANGFRQVFFKVNGATVIGAQLVHADAAVGNQQTISTQYRLSANDYVEVWVQQSSGGNLNVTSAANYSPEFSMHWVSP